MTSKLPRSSYLAAQLQYAGLFDIPSGDVEALNPALCIRSDAGTSKWFNIDGVFVNELSMSMLNLYLRTQFMDTLIDVEVPRSDLNIHLMDPCQLVRWFVPETEREQVLYDALASLVSEEEKLEEAVETASEDITVLKSEKEELANAAYALVGACLTLENDYAVVLNTLQESLEAAVEKVRSDLTSVVSSVLEKSQEMSDSLEDNGGKE